jgi:hypothetical protein
MGITSTAWGTRWYLTLFNYSLPFQAQLRVWDVFMLLGDASHSNDPTSKFSGDLDVLHATSAALIDATREILLDSDFENAMKVLTSWIPISSCAWQEPNISCERSGQVLEKGRRSDPWT